MVALKIGSQNLGFVKMHIREDIRLLKENYNRLSRWWKLFYPRELAHALSANNTPRCLEIINCAFNSTWFFHRWIFSGLKQFFNSPLIKNSSKLFTNKSDRKWLHLHGNDNALQFILKLNHANDAHPSITYRFMEILKTRTPYIWPILSFLGTLQCMPYQTLRDLGQFIENLHTNPNKPAVAQLAHFMQHLASRYDLLTQASVVKNLLQHPEPNTLRKCLDLMHKEGALTAQTLQQICRLPHLHELFLQLENAYHSRAVVDESRAQRMQRIIHDTPYHPIPRTTNGHLFGQPAQAHQPIDVNEEAWNSLQTLLADADMRVTADMREKMRKHPAFDDLFRALNQLHAINLLNSTHFNAVLNANNPQALVESMAPEARVQHTNSTHSLFHASRRSLKEISTMKESSMQPLTHDEHCTLTNIKRHYQQQTVSFEHVIQNLAERYRLHPASLVKNNGDTIELPLEHDQLMDLKLNGDERRRAHILYYKHVTHTCWLYLRTGANPWSFQPKSRASISPDFEDMVAILWVAVNDRTQTPRPGQGSVDDRIDLFLTEIALIARAHNHDNRYALNTDALGEPIRDNNGCTRHGCFDDLRADHPSCSMGIMSRLFQSINAHPLFQPLPPIEHEFIGALKDHFQQKLRQYSYDQLMSLEDAFDEIPFQPTQEQRQHVKAMNMSSSQEQAFHRYLEKKYPAYQQSLDMKTTVSSYMANDYQWVKFADSAGVNQLMENAKKRAKLESAISLGIFSASCANNNEQLDNTTLTINIS